MIQLQPLAKRPLSSQLYNLTGDFYSDHSYTRQADTITHILTGKVFKFASMQDERIYKLHAKINERGEEEAKAHKYDHIKYPFIDLNNRQRWIKGLEKLKEQGNPIVEMCEESYDHFLGCVPPREFSLKSFVCGEPYSHNNQGEGIYLCGLNRNGKFYAQYGTIRQYRKGELFKSL